MDLYEYFKEKYPQNFGSPSFIEFSCGPGWKELIENIFKIMKDTDCKVEQVKEKFGGLRFYTDHETPAVSDLIKIAELESYKVCEECGTRKFVKTEGGWLKTLCKFCRDKRFQKVEENKKST
jgi:hypothetical protein